MFKRFLLWLKSKLVHVDQVGIGEELHIEQWRNGKKIVDRTYKAHSAVNAGLALAADRVGAVTAAAAVTYLALGTDATAVGATQTALLAEITDTGLARASATVSAVQTTVAGDTLQLYHDWTATGAKVLREIAALNANAAGTMLARKVYDAITTANTDHVIMTYKFPFTAV
jgi:type IV secretory pathway TrbL component